MRVARYNGTPAAIVTAGITSCPFIEWKMDSKYGRQFSVESFEETLPATVLGIEKYLGSGLVKGIGPKFAGRIVNAFGTETLDVIEERPDELLKVPGIGSVRVERIKASWQEQKEIKNIMLFLQSHDVSTSHATKIYKTYGEDSVRVVQENPYRLADDIWGIGFRTADTIAEKMGFDHNKYVRLRSGLLYTLNKLSEEGHCYATRKMLLETGSELLDVDVSLLSQALDRMLQEEDVKHEPLPLSRETAIYLPPFYYAEIGVAKRLWEIYGGERKITISPEGLEERILAKTGMDYDEIQLKAISTAVKSKILILTGGPGTGKTTTTLGIISALREAGASVLLAAPTGRAAKRLSEATGMEAKTIHRLLEFKPPEGYQKNEKTPLEGDVLIVDDLQELSGVTKTQNVFFHIFNQLHQTGKQLILTADRSPVEMQGVEERLLTRFKWGMLAEMEKPNEELRRKILLYKVHHNGLNISEDVINYIAHVAQESVRDLEGIINALMAYSVVFNSSIDMALAEKVVNRTVKFVKKKITIEDIIQKSCNAFGVSEEDVYSQSRKANIVRARQVAMFLAQKHTDLSTTRIGTLIGKRNHATVLHSIKLIEDQINLIKECINCLLCLIKSHIS